MSLSKSTLMVVSIFNSTEKSNEPAPSDNEEDGLLARFVVDGFGKKIGESIAINDDILIVKSGVFYLGVPLKHIEPEGKRIMVKGLIDQQKAKELGEKWRKTSYKKIKYPEEE